MKLTWDVLAVVIKALFTLVLGMTLLAAGSTLWSKTKKASETIGPTLEELRAQHEKAKEDFEKVKQRRDETLQNTAHIQELQSEVQGASAYTSALKESIKSLQADAERLQNSAQRRSKEFSTDLSTWEGTNDDRNTVFRATICQKIGGWKEDKCGEILNDARVTESSGENLQALDAMQWRNRVDRALGSACDKDAEKMGNWFDQNILSNRVANAAWTQMTGWRACSKKQRAAQLSLDSFGEYLQLHAQYQSLLRAYEKKKDEIQSKENALQETRETINKLLIEELEMNAAYTQARDALDDAHLAYSEALSDPRAFVENLLAKWWTLVRPYFLTMLGILLAMVLWRPLIYFGIAPIAGKLRRVSLLPTVPAPMILRSAYAEAESETAVLSPPAHLRVTADQRKQLVHLKPNEKLWVRPDYVVSSRGGGAQWIYGGWQHPFTSYAAGLIGMTVFDGSKPGQDQGIAIAGTGEAYANAYITRVELTNHPGFVLRTSHVVAMQGDLKVRARWSFRPVSLLRGQVRFMVAEGTGSIYFVGYGGAFPHTPSKQKAQVELQDAAMHDLDQTYALTENTQNLPDDVRTSVDAKSEKIIHQLHDGLVIGWDARLEFGLERNENWIDVAVRRKSAMFESSFAGEGIYITTNAVQTRSKDIAGRMLEALLGTFGKILGI